MSGNREQPTVNIPDFKVTSDDDHNTTSAPQQGHTPATAGLLSPVGTSGRAHGRNASLDAPSSPTPSDDGSSVNIPPSPTLSTNSVHFQTSLALRDNNVDANSGSGSLGLLAPGDDKTHRRIPSNATVGSNDGTEPASGHDLAKMSSAAASDTATAFSEKSKKNKSKSKKSSDPEKAAIEEGEEAATAKAELTQDEDVDPAPFAFRPFALASILDPKSLDDLEALGGIDGVLKGVGANPSTGLEGKVDEKHPVSEGGAFGASLDDRRRVYGPNSIPTRPSKSLLQLMWAAMKDKVLILLAIAAAISLALGFFQAFAPIFEHPPGEPPVEWVEGVAVLIAILIVVVVGSLNDWQKERQFKKLNEQKEERGVKVIRGGVEKIIDVKEVLVGDIALIEPGEIIPCDGLFLSGHNVKCDESGATGESDAIKKVPYEECLALREKLKKDGKAFDSAHTDCFIISGSKVLEGVGKYVIVAVGQKSFNGRILMALRGDSDITPLQLKLNRLATLIAKLGSAAGLALFTALMIRFFVQLGKGEPVRSASEKGVAFVDILIISVTLIVVAVPEGLPLAVTLALAFATKRMTYEKLLVRVLSSCETMANASVICTDKTGTLTQNDMTVVAGCLGIHAKFVRQLDENKSRTNAEGEEASRKHADDFSVDQAKLNDIMTQQLQDLFNEAVAVNSTAFEDTDPETKELVFVGSKTETALLKFAKDMGWKSFRQTRESANIIQMIPFSSERKAMGVVLKMSNGKHRIYLKGASEILSKKCVRHVVVRKDGPTSGSEIETAPIGELEAENISRTIIFYANQMLRTISICYKDFESWPPANATRNDDGEVEYESLAKDLTLIGITGIEDPLRDGVREAVISCHRAGVTVKMCTGDNVLTARSIASQCGIFTPGGIIMEGPVFRALDKPERVDIVPRLQVLARSSPEDKQLLVETLKELGEIVGVTGDGTNDGPALKKANVGFSMGIAGTEVAKEASDIILMDDNFASIVKAIMWGRCVNDAVRKFLQFQISTNVTAVVITFVTAVASEREESVLTAVQLLWINIIMDTFAALALATDPATESLLDRKPDRRTAPLFSTDMYKMIMFQSMYQIFIIFLFHFAGARLLGYDDSDESRRIIKTLVFNIFVFAQIFNSINCRRLDRKLNIFENIHKNYYFMGITVLEAAIQVLIVFVGGVAIQVVHIPGREWGISIALGFFSIPLGVIVRLIPSGPFERLFTRFGWLGHSDVLPTQSPESEQGWNGAISLVRDNLGTFAQVRGGRVRSSSFVGKHRRARDRPEHLGISSVLAMAPTLMVGAVATGQAYKAQAGNLHDPASSDPSRSSAALWQGKLQIHPDTAPEDPVYTRYAGSQNAKE